MSNKTPPPVYCLIVDDLDENLRALEALLRRDGVVFLKAQSGPEALEYLLQYDAALAILDVQMPGMDGFELAELMRGAERTRRVPIIFTTAGSADSRRRFRGYEAGAVDFLPKPIEADVLRSKADVFFELYRQRQEVAAQRDELQSAINENARLLSESRRHAAALEEADRRKDHFLAVLAHELRNPLGPIRTAVEIVKLSQDRSEVMLRSQEIIDRQIGHMSRLIDDLLDVARIAQGKIQLQLAVCDFAEIVRQTTEDYRTAFQQAGVELHVNLPQSLPVTGDSTRLAQIVGNLLHNAAKFTPPGGSVSVVGRRFDEHGLASVEVCDDGAGMSPEMVSRVFEPFTQDEQGIDRAKGGLGLGLALAKGIVDLHNGSVRAASEGPGHGSEFTIELPLASETVGVSTQLPETRSKSGGLTVLIVEDNRDAARSLEMLLRLLGCQVMVAGTGHAALEAVKKRRPDVVVSDLGLPGGIDGFELARRLRSNVGDSIRLVAVSGYGQPSDIDRSRSAGFDLHLVKPVDALRLRNAVGLD